MQVEKELAPCAWATVAWASMELTNGRSITAPLASMPEAVAMLRTQEASELPFCRTCAENADMCECRTKLDSKEGLKLRPHARGSAGVALPLAIFGVLPLAVPRKDDHDRRGELGAFGDIKRFSNAGLRFAASLAASLTDSIDFKDVRFPLSR